MSLSNNNHSDLGRRINPQFLARPWMIVSTFSPYLMSNYALRRRGTSIIDLVRKEQLNKPIKPTSFKDLLELSLGNPILKAFISCNQT